MANNENTYFENLVRGMSFFHKFNIVMSAYNMLKKALEHAEESHTNWVKFEEGKNEQEKDFYWYRSLYEDSQAKGLLEAYKSFTDRKVYSHFNAITDEIKWLEDRFNIKGGTMRV